MDRHRLEADWLISRIEEKGWRGRVVPIERLADLREAIEGRRRSGLLSEEFCRTQLGGFSFQPPPDLPGARSIVIVALSVPPVRVPFAWKGRQVPVIIPPTYIDYTARTVAVRAAIAEWLAGEGFKVAAARLPLKTLAVSSGLAGYGRNNIAYVEGLGSYMQLAAAFTDMPCSSDPWREPEVMGRCASCGACALSCPTGAIGEDRILLHVDRCLTFFNEDEAEFPEWIDPAWHNSAIGCMRCQEACPGNAPLAACIEDREGFSETETEAILRGAPLEQLPNGTASRLAGLGLNAGYEILSRNLSAVIESFLMR